MAVELTWLGHASFRIAGSQVVYIDPWKLSEASRADVIIVSHDHYDHLSLEDIKAVSGPDTQVVAPADAAGKLSGVAVQTIAPSEHVELNGVTSEATHIYDRRHSVFYAWRTLCRQWSLAFEIGRENRARGTRPESLKGFWRELTTYRQEKSAAQREDFPE